MYAHMIESMIVNVENSCERIKKSLGIKIHVHNILVYITSEKEILMKRCKQKFNHNEHFHK